MTQDDNGSVDFPKAKVDTVIGHFHRVVGASNEENSFPRSLVTPRGLRRLPPSPLKDERSMPMFLEVSPFQDVRQRSPASPGTEPSGLKQEWTQALASRQGGLYGRVRSLSWSSPGQLCPGKANAHGRRNKQTQRTMTSLSNMLR